MTWLVAMALLLHPAVLEDTPVRAVALGADVEWVLDGKPIATSFDGQPVTFNLTSGSHELRAESKATGAWEILVRPEPAGPGAQYVPAWTAARETSQTSAPEGWLPGLLGVLAAVVVLMPKHSKKP